MSLSCTCGEWDGEGWFYIPPDDFTPFQKLRRKRCVSCKEPISCGDTSLKFERFRAPVGDIETRIMGEDAEIRIASWFLCEKCGDQYFNLAELGFCINLPANIFELLKEYQETYGKGSIT